MSDVLNIGATCLYGHSLSLVAEGYALCEEQQLNSSYRFYAWKFGPHTTEWSTGFFRYRNDQLEPANVWPDMLPTTKADCLEFIQADIDRQRAAPFDEERERARLIPV